MLTAKINNNLINCYDGKYYKEDLKTWASKDIIKCPICGKSYEYCHGQINTPYFRHKDKSECDYLYSEPETEEHIKGKIALYNWIKKQDGVTNTVLEAWIPETKQRPDIMFEYGGSKWVIEYQCSPIATEYITRHKLYQAGGINDIWICGTENYKIDSARKVMEYLIGIYYDVNKDELHVNQNSLSFVSIHKMISVSYKNPKIFTYKLSDLKFENNFYSSIPCYDDLCLSDENNWAIFNEYKLLNTNYDNLNMGIIENYYNNKFFLDKETKNIYLNIYKSGMTVLYCSNQEYYIRIDNEKSILYAEKSWCRVATYQFSNKDISFNDYIAGMDFIISECLKMYKEYKHDISEYRREQREFEEECRQANIKRAKLHEEYLQIWNVDATKSNLNKIIKKIEKRAGKIQSRNIYVSTLFNGGDAYRENKRLEPIYRFDVHSISDKKHTDFCIRFFIKYQSHQLYVQQSYSKNSGVCLCKYQTDKEMYEIIEDMLIATLRNCLK